MVLAQFLGYEHLLPLLNIDDKKLLDDLDLSEQALDQGYAADSLEAHGHAMLDQHRSSLCSYESELRHFLLVDFGFLVQFVGIACEDVFWAILLGRFLDQDFPQEVLLMVDDLLFKHAIFVYFYFLLTIHILKHRLLNPLQYYWIFNLVYDTWQIELYNTSNESLQLLIVEVVVDSHVQLRFFFTWPWNAT